MAVRGRWWQAVFSAKESMVSKRQQKAQLYRQGTRKRKTAHEDEDGMAGEGEGSQGAEQTAVDADNQTTTATQPAAKQEETTATSKKKKKKRYILFIGN